MIFMGNKFSCITVAMVILPNVPTTIVIILLILSSEPEPQILDYITQQHKLFICIATSYALQLTSDWLWKTFNAVTADMKQGNTDSLPEVTINKNNNITIRQRET